MASCNVQDLLENAACFDCLSPGLKESVKLQLLCDIQAGGGGGGGSVSSFAFTNANGISGVVTNPASTPNLTLSLGNITPTKVNGITITAGAGTLTLGAVTLNAGPGGTLGTAAFTAASAYEVPLTFAGGLDRSVNTISPGALTPTSAAFSGTGGNGFIKLLTQSSAPSAPASGFALFANATGRFSWLNAGDGFTRSFEVTATGNRVFTLPNADFTFAGLSLAQTFSAANTFSASSAVSTAATQFTGAPATGGSASTTIPLVKVGGGTDAAYSTSGTVLAVNAPNAFVGNLQQWLLNGSSVGTMSAGGSLGIAGSISLSTASATIGWNADAFIGRTGAGNIRLGGADGASPVAQQFSVQNATGNDTAGADWTQRCSLSTGSGKGGGWILTQSLSIAATAVQNSASTRKYFSAKPTALTSGNDITLFTVTVGTSKYIGIKVTAVVNVASATDFQCQTSTALIAVVNKSGTLTLSTVTQADSGVAASSGTLTPVTYKIVDNGSGVLAVKCNATTSLTPVTFGCKWQCEIGSNDVATVTAS